MSLRGELFPSSEREPSRDMLHTFSTASARLPTMPAISPIKVFRRALASEDSPKQVPVRDREAIIALARTRSRRRSDAADDRASAEGLNAVEKLPWLRRASSC